MTESAGASTDWRNRVRGAPKASLSGWAVTVIGAMFLAGCLHHPAERAGRIAAENGWRPVVWRGAMLPVCGYIKTSPGPAATEWIVYLEGDGHAWDDRHSPSTDPTPKVPLALQLAIQDPSPNVLYLGRPCQYECRNDIRCHQRYWTSHRYAETVIDSMDAAIKGVIGKKADKIGLIGYSGGGAVAVLLADRRDDVDWLITIAGNLDHGAWTNYHGVSPLSGSLEPADAAEGVQHIPQVHYVGEEDDIVPKAVVRGFLDRMSDPERSHLIEIPSRGHRDGWREDWVKLRAQAMLKVEEEFK